MEICQKNYVWDWKVCIKEKISSRNNKFQLNICQANMEIQMYEQMHKLMIYSTVNAGWEWPSTWHIHLWLLVEIKNMSSTTTIKLLVKRLLWWMLIDSSMYFIIDFMNDAEMYNFVVMFCLYFPLFCVCVCVCVCMQIFTSVIVHANACVLKFAFCTSTDF